MTPTADAPIPDQEPFAALARRALDARGSRDDQQWVSRASIALIMDGHAATDAAAGALEEQVELLETAGPESSESASDLLGPAKEWADEQVASWKETGADTFDESPTFTWRSGLIAVPGAAVLFTLLLGVSQLLHGDLSTTWSPGLVLMPLVLGALVIAAIAIYDALKRHTSFAMTAIGTGLFVIAMAAASAGLFGALSAPKQPASLAWILPLAGAYLLSAVLLARTLPRGASSAKAGMGPGAGASTAHAASDPSPAAGPDGAAADDAWEAACRRTARIRDDLSDTQVEQALAEARAHAREAGTSLAAQFGNPEAYARALPGDARVPRRRMVALVGVQLLGVIGLIALHYADGQDWGWNMSSAMLVAWALLLAWSLIGEVRRARRSTAAG